MAAELFEDTRFPPPRQFPRSARVRCEAGESTLIRQLTSDDYPLVEIVADHLLDGCWLYLHPDANGAEIPRFVAHSTSAALKRACHDMISSYYARTTPPVTPPPAGVAYVYTSLDHTKE